jgi:hypothetical protein
MVISISAEELALDQSTILSKIVDVRKPMQYKTAHVKVAEKYSIS